MFRFYFRGIDRKQSEKILLRTNIENKTFMIRDGSKTGNYVLTARNNSKVDHCMINIQNGKYSLDGLIQFDTVEEMINYYTTTVNRKMLSNCISKGNVHMPM